MKKMYIPWSTRFDEKELRIVLSAFHRQEQFWIHHNYSIYQSILNKNQRIINKIYCYSEPIEIDNGEPGFEYESHEYFGYLSKEELQSVVDSLIFDVKASLGINTDAINANIEADIQKIEKRKCAVIDTPITDFLALRKLRKICKGKNQNILFGHDPIENQFTVIDKNEDAVQTETDSNAVIISFTQE